MLIMQSQVDVQKSTVTSLSQKWDEHATEIEEKQKLNPFSGTYEGKMTITGNSGITEHRPSYRNIHTFKQTDTQVLLYLKADSRYIQ